MKTDFIKFIIHLSKVLLNPWGTQEGFIGTEGQTHKSPPCILINKIMCLSACTAAKAGVKCKNMI